MRPAPGAATASNAEALDPAGMLADMLCCSEQALVAMIADIVPVVDVARAPRALRPLVGTELPATCACKQDAVCLVEGLGWRVSGLW